jgi:hypothetical protein
MNLRRSTLTLIPLLALGVAHADHPTLTLEDGSPGPLTTISGTTMPKGTFTSAFVNQIILFNGMSDAQLLGYSGREDIVHSTDRLVNSALNAAYGVSDDLTVGFSLPYVWRTNLREVIDEPVGVKGVQTRVRPTPRHGGVSHGGHGGGDDGVRTRPVVTNVGDSHGLGDLTTFAQYRFLHDEAAERHLSAIAGLRMPTGETGVLMNDGQVFSPHHQPGSGAWDPMFGLAFTQGAGRWSFDANVLFLFAQEGARDSNLGDVFNYNAAVSYRLLGACSEDEPHEPGVTHEHPTTLDLIFEANGDARGRVYEEGFIDANTGGNLVFLSGGARLSWGHSWAATASLGAPILEDLNGIQSEPVMRILFGISKAF